MDTKVTKENLQEFATKLNEKQKTIFAKKSADNNTILPIYVGDCLSPSNALPSSVIKIGDTFYMFEANTREYNRNHSTNEGVIRKFSITDNEEKIAEKISANIGHANSVAYDPEGGRIYVAPIWDTSSGTEVAANYLYVFNENLEQISNLETPTTAMGVSFDHVTGMLFYFDYNQNVYKKVGDEWTLYCSINVPNENISGSLGRSYNQDFAVYNNRFYVSSPYGNIISGELDIGNYNINPDSFRNVANCDSTDNFTLGELEGFEFDENGHLYAVDYVDISSELRNAFIVELNVGTAFCTSPAIMGGLFKVTNGTLNLSERTQTAFRLSSYEIRSLQQLSCKRLINGAARVEIISGNTVIEPYSIRIIKNITLVLSGSYTAREIILYGAKVVLYANGGQLTLTTSNLGISVFNTSELTIGGQNALDISLPNRLDGNDFIAVSYYFPAISIRTIPICVEGYDLCIGSTPIKYEGLYQGSTFISPLYVSNVYSSKKVTYKANNYINQTNAERCYLYRTGARTGIVKINVLTNSTIPNGTAVTFANLGESILQTAVDVVSGQNDGTSALVMIEKNGDISITASQNALDAQFFRDTIPVILYQ